MPCGAGLCGELLLSGSYKGALVGTSIIPIAVLAVSDTKIKDLWETLL